MPPHAPPAAAKEELIKLLGPTMAQARRTLAAITKPHRIGQKFASDVLVRLLRFQTTKRVDPGRVTHFMRARRAPHNHVCLFAVTEDGQTADMSLTKTVRNLYGKHDKAAEKRRNGIAAFRNEAFFTAKMQAARAEFTTGKCADCGRRRKLAVDHCGKPFAQILDEFIAHRGAVFARIGLAWSNGGHALRHRGLANAWRAWHDEHAELTGLCRACNSAKGSGGYKHSLETRAEAP
jgi:5-methylcytosine-specific restriction endonuclease McrA